MRLFGGREAAAWSWPYTPDECDRVVPLEGAPEYDFGAPLPTVLASEHQLFLVCLLNERSAPWYGSEESRGRPEGTDLPVAVIEFRNALVHFFGPPNEEIIAAHPLAARGLTAHDAHRVENSSWIRALERMNSIHPRHWPERFRRLNHYVFAFHDSVFECAAEGFDATLHRGSLACVVAEVAARLR
ncbi:MAG TPA: hypothetical protein VFQ39_02390 [Longimicrobium sp.]|nr:hypothetical protein [Longimicrobium sp.]